MNMQRKFRTVDPTQAQALQIELAAYLPEGHLAYFVADVVRQLNLQPLYATYGTQGAPPYAPEVLLSLLLYGYATGTFSTRALEAATYESLPYIFLAGGLHPDHDTFADFRQRALPHLSDLFTDALLLAHQAGVFQLGNLSIDGTKLQANASKSKAVSGGRLTPLMDQLRQEVAELLALAATADTGTLPPGLHLPAEITRRETYLARLETAQQALEARAAERYAAEKEVYETKLAARKAREEATQRPCRGKAPTAPIAGVRATDQYNFTDPESRISKNSRDQGFNQHYNGQIAVDQASRLVVATSLSSQANDQGTLPATLAALQALPPQLGAVASAALDTGYCSARNIALLEAAGIVPYIGTGREPHHQSWQARFAALPEPPAATASALERMAYQLRTPAGKERYRQRKSTVEPVIGILKAVQRFRQCSLRGEAQVRGEWQLVCLAYNVRRLRVLQASDGSA